MWTKFPGPQNTGAAAQSESGAQPRQSKAYAGRKRCAARPRGALPCQGDHHSTITRVRAGLQAADVGIPDGWPDYVLHQMVTVMRGGQEVKISKRAGSYVTLSDLIEEVGKGEGG